MVDIVNSQTGNDTIILDMVFQLNNFPNGKIWVLSYDDTLVEQKIGKNGNSIAVYKQVGNKAKLILRTLRASADDILLESRRLLMKKDFPSFIPLHLSLAKRFGDGTGKIKTETHFCSNGLFSKNSEVETDVDGDTEQSVTSYEISFSSVIRTLV